MKTFQEHNINLTKQQLDSQIQLEKEKPCIIQPTQDFLKNLKSFSSAYFDTTQSKHTGRCAFFFDKADMNSRSYHIAQRYDCSQSLSLCGYYTIKKRWSQPSLSSISPRTYAPIILGRGTRIELANNQSHNLVRLPFSPPNPFWCVQQESNLRYLD